MGNNACIRTKVDEHKIESCKGVIDNHDVSFIRLSETLGLAANQVRLKILYLLSTEESLCVCDLSDILKMNISAISQHLRKLKDKNMIIPERQGQTIFYAVNQEYHQLLSMLFSHIEADKS